MAVCERREIDLGPRPQLPDPEQWRGHARFCSGRYRVGHVARLSGGVSHRGRQAGTRVAGLRDAENAGPCAMAADFSHAREIARPCRSSGAGAGGRSSLGGIDVLNVAGQPAGSLAGTACRCPDCIAPAPEAAQRSGQQRVFPIGQALIMTRKCRQSAGSRRLR